MSPEVSRLSVPWRHVAAVAVVLTALVPLFGGGALFSADEGALLAQVDVLDGEGRWTLPAPAPELDPERQALPIEFPFVGADGTWAPFQKHAVYVQVVTWSTTVVGSRGPWLLSVLGTVLAVAAAAALSARIDRRAAVPTVWIAGFATPLFFDAYLVMAHTIGAALAGWAAVLALDALHRARLPVSALRMAGAAACLVALVTVRTEGALFAVALAVGIVVAAVASAGRDVARRALLVAAVVLLGAAGGWLAEDSINERAWGEPAAATADPETSSAEPGTGIVRDRVEGFETTWLRPAYDRSGPAVLTVVGVALVWCAAVVVRRAGARRDVARLLLVVGAACVAARLLDATQVVPGLLVACPVLAGVVGLTRVQLRRVAVLAPAAALALFAVAVVATQYSSGGSGEWGGSYFAIGLPLAAPLAVVGGRALLARLDGGTRRIAIAAGGIVLATLLVVAAVSLDEAQRRSALAAEAVGDARRSVGSARAPAAVLTTDGAIGRFAREDALDGPFLTVDRDDLERYSGRLHDAGEPIVFFTRAPERDLVVLERLWVVEPLVGRSVYALTPR